MTETDLPYIKPPPEISPETDENLSPSPDVKNPLPNHEAIENIRTGTFDCQICGKSFYTKTDLDLHMITNHKQTKKT